MFSSDSQGGRSIVCGCLLGLGVWLLGGLAAVSAQSPAGRGIVPELGFDPFDQSGVPLEEDPPAGFTGRKIVILAGVKSHGPGDHEFFAGSVILTKLLRQTPGVWPVLVRDGWPKRESVLDGAASLVFYMDGRGGHPVVQGDRLAKLRQRVEAGTGWVNLHYAVDYLPKDGDQIVRWMGGYYDPRISTNPHWDARIRSLPEHPITRGVRPFTLRDEWYFNMRWIDHAEDIRDAKRVQPILQAIPPDDRRGTADAKRFLGRMETLAWASEQPGLGRSFGFTGGHSHRNWGSEPFRRIVVQGILWTAKLEIPTEGAPVALDPIELNRHLDYKGKPFQKILPPADER